jgi:hypothetical protein
VLSGDLLTSAAERIAENDSGSQLPGAEPQRPFRFGGMGVFMIAPARLVSEELRQYH